MAPGAQDWITGEMPQVVKEGGVGLSEGMSAVFHEMCHALWTAAVSLIVAKHASWEMPSIGRSVRYPVEVEKVEKVNPLRLDKVATVSPK